MPRSHTAKKGKKTPKSSGAAKRTASKRMIEPAVPAKPWRRLSKYAALIIKNEKLFVLASLGVLALTTIYWSVLSARLHEVNADQFIDTYLFESAGTFRDALFPGAHTFLVKWPLFALMHIFGHNPGIFMVGTVLMVLATVAALVYVLYRIEPRPVVFGLLCLVLASVLLLVPAQPHPGALLPSNFAMTTTRNLEYVLFIFCLYRLLAVKNIRSIWFWGLSGLMALVIASDKLFSVLAIGSALIVLAGYVGLLRRRYELTLALRWLLLGIMAFGLANVLLYALSRLGVTHIIDETSASPFAAVHSLKQLFEGVLFGAGALLTNFGANPVHGVTIIRDIPLAFLKSLLHPAALAYAFNFALFGYALWAVINVVRTHATDAATRLTVYLSAATLASLVVFVFTDHYYPVDSRYITIELFALFIALATYLRGRQLSKGFIMSVIACLIVVLPIGAVKSYQEFDAGRAVLAEKTATIKIAASILDKEQIGRLMGNYWDVTPVKARADRKVTIAPVEGCVQPRQALNSLAWFKVPDSTPMAYLVTRDPGKTTYAGCSLARLASLYGTPSERVTLASNPAPPHEANALLLLYADGIKPLIDKKPAVSAPSPLPAIKVSALGNRTMCQDTTLNVVAHQDDDVLFMNPDIASDIRSGRCVRTVYLTAGDAGQAYGYWSSRELGAKAAYAHMYNVPNDWRDQREMVGGKFATVSYLNKAPGVALVFLRLPDGNIYGEGFAGTHNESLNRLVHGAESEIHTVDDGTAYSKDQIVTVLAELMNTDLPDRIRSQGSELTGIGGEYGDHSDHLAGGIITRLAAKKYTDAHTLWAYTGYPVRLQPVNLFDADVADKQETFLTYAKYDGAVCQTAFECHQTFTYGSYLIRQYKSEE